MGSVALKAHGLNSGKDGVQDKGTCPLAPSRESGLAEESPSHGEGQKSTVDKSPDSGAPKIRGQPWRSLLCLSALISKMGTPGARRVGIKVSSKR